MIDSLIQDNLEGNLNKVESDFFEEHSNTESTNDTNDQSSVLSSRKVSQVITLM